MTQGDVVAYNIAAFLATLFLLEFGADKFIDHTAIVARRTGLSETIIGLLTAGGEWEEVSSHHFTLLKTNEGSCRLTSASLLLLSHLSREAAHLWQSATSSVQPSLISWAHFLSVSCSMRRESRLSLTEARGYTRSFYSF